MRGSITDMPAQGPNSWAVTIIGGVIVLIIGWMFRGVLSVALGRIRKWFGGIFRGRLHFVHQRHRRSAGRVGMSPAMGIMLDLWVTSSYEGPIAILRGELRYRKGLRRHRISQIQMSTKLLPRRPTDFRVLFMLVPPPVPDMEPFKASAYFIDNYGRRHKAGSFTFVHHNPGETYLPD